MRQDFSLYQSIPGRPMLRYRDIMLMMSHEVEDATLVDGAWNRLFVGFQHMSRFMHQIERYRQLAARAESVIVFGSGDTQPPPIDNLRYVYLPDGHALLDEWFLVSYGTAYFTAIAAYQEEPDAFRGTWTFHADHVRTLAIMVSEALDLPPYPLEAALTATGHDYLHQIDLMLNTSRRLSERVRRHMNRRIV